MASYKQPCIHCDTFIERDSRICPYCGSRSPFVYLCPTCHKEISKDMMVCPGCGRELYIACPHCGQRTFVEEKCNSCGRSLMINCTNKRCGALQFYENTKCTVCGKKIKKK